MVLFGAGGHGKVVISILENQKVSITSVIDDDPEVNEILGYKVIHVDDYRFQSTDQCILSIGSNRIRNEKCVQLSKCSFGKAVHPSAVLSIHSDIGAGTVVMPQVVVHPSSNIAEHCIINSGAVVEHDCQIADFVHVAPNATICGGCKIGSGTLIGAGAVVVPGISIGDWCTVGAGAVVTKDIEDGATVVGNPAGIINL